MAVVLPTEVNRAHDLPCPSLVCVSYDQDPDAAARTTPSRPTLSPRGYPAPQTYHQSQCPLWTRVWQGPEAGKGGGTASRQSESTSSRARDCVKS